jgi:hypothetical protein
MAKTRWCCIKRCEKRGDARVNYEQLGDVYCTLHAFDIYEAKVDTLLSKNAALIKQRNKTSTDLQNVVNDLGIGWMIERRKAQQPMLSGMETEEVSKMALERARLIETRPIRPGMFPKWTEL